MKEELRIDIVGLAGACSYALDCIEAELVKIKNKHGKRVAYISVCMAEYLAIQGDALQDLASILKIKSPPSCFVMRYAYNAVRRFPTCILPVGLGANLVLTLLIAFFSSLFS